MGAGKAHHFARDVAGAAGLDHHALVTIDLRTWNHDECVSVLAGHRGKGLVQRVGTPHLEGLQLQPEGLGCRLGLLDGAYGSVSMPQRGKRVDQGDSPQMGVDARRRLRDAARRARDR